MKIHCPNCKEDSACKVSKSHDKVYCTACYHEVETTDFFKQALINQKDYYSGPTLDGFAASDFQERFNKSFSFICYSCHAQQPAALLSDNQAVCLVCKSDLHLSAPMIAALGINGKLLDKYIGVYRPSNNSPKSSALISEKVVHAKQEKKKDSIPISTNDLIVLKKRPKLLNEQ
jgi:hypothetical protein